MPDLSDAAARAVARPAARLLAVLLLVCASSPARAAGRSVIVLAPATADDRIEPSHEAVAYWNDRLAELGLRLRLEAPDVVVDAPEARTIETYARQVATRAVGLPGGAYEPPPPADLTRLDADIVILLSRQDIMSFTWPMPSVSPPRHLVVVRAVRGPYRNDPMVSRHVLAHELGHALGLDHNNEPHTLMCGPCQPLTAEPDETGFLPLTDGDRARLIELHGAR